MSKQAMKRHVLLMMIGVISLNLAIAVIAVLLEGAFAAGISKVVLNLIPNKTVVTVIDTIFRVATVILYVLIVIVATPLIHAYICAHFYEREGDMDYEEFKKLHVNKIQEREEKILLSRSRKKQRTFLASIVAFGLILNGLLCVSVNQQLHVLSYCISDECIGDSASRGCRKCTGEYNACI